MISEKGLCKILKSAYKNSGYSIIQVRRKVEGLSRSWQRNEIIINGATWAVRCQAEDLPKAAAVQIVGDVGYMPMDAVTVQKNQPNQTMLESIADTRSDSLDALNGGGVRMRQIRDLKLQPQFTIQEAYTTPEGQRVRAIRYQADFSYERATEPDCNGEIHWLRVVEDVKSRATKTRVYEIKKKLLREKLGIEIREV